MTTYRIVPIKGIKKEKYTEKAWECLNKFRVDRQHSLLFGLINYFDHGAFDLIPSYLFPSVEKAILAISNVNCGKNYKVYQVIEEK